MKKDILSDIVTQKRIEINRQKQVTPTGLLREEMESYIRTHPATRSMKQALAASPTGIIAEFKRRSPSKGWIHPEAEIGRIVPAYGQAGATALSILTDETFFGGSLADLRTARLQTELPLLRKDFIIDSYQLMQARLAGADAVLLIASCLEQDECDRLIDQAHAIGLEVLLEIHTADELDYITPQVDMAGINNRHLGSFHTDVQTSFRLAEQLKEAAQKAGRPLLVSESGISHPETILQLRQTGYRGFLIGERFMKMPQPGDALRTFILQLSATTL